MLFVGYSPHRLPILRSLIADTFLRSRSLRYVRVLRLPALIVGYAVLGLHARYLHYCRFTHAHPAHTVRARWTTPRVTPRTYGYTLRTYWVHTYAPPPFTDLPHHHTLFLLHVYLHAPSARAHAFCARAFRTTHLAPLRRTTAPLPPHFTAFVFGSHRCCLVAVAV